jgi:hypothetical protein
MMMMIVSAFTVKTGVQSPQKAWSSAPGVQSGPIIHARASTATTVRPSTSALDAYIKFLGYVLYLDFLFSFFIH